MWVSGPFLKFFVPLGDLSRDQNVPRNKNSSIEHTYKPLQLKIRVEKYISEISYKNRIVSGLLAPNPLNYKDLRKRVLYLRKQEMFYKVTQPVSSLILIQI